MQASVVLDSEVIYASLLISQAHQSVSFTDTDPLVLTTGPLDAYRIYLRLNLVPLVYLEEHH